MILRKVNISAVEGTDIQYFQRPRMKPDKDFSAVLKYFPPIEGRQINDAILTPKKKRKPWRISLEGIHASGTHQIWIYQLKGTIEGELQADLAIQTQSGPFSIENGFVDLAIQSLLINGDNEVLRQGSFKGELAIAPIVFKENKGIKAIPYVITDFEVDADVDSLAFLNLFSGNFHGMKINGAGELNGHLIMDRGILLPATDMIVAAHKLSVAVMSHRVEGEGSIRLDVSASKPESLNLDIQFTTWRHFTGMIPGRLSLAKGWLFQVVVKLVCPWFKIRTMV